MHINMSFHVHIIYVSASQSPYIQFNDNPIAHMYLFAV